VSKLATSTSAKPASVFELVSLNAIDQVKRQTPTTKNIGMTRVFDTQGEKLPI
jgi:hypothetical protein